MSGNKGQHKVLGKVKVQNKQYVWKDNSSFHGPHHFLELHILLGQGCSGFREEGKKSELVRTPEIMFLLHMTQSVRQKGSPAELGAPYEISSLL